MSETTTLLVSDRARPWLTHPELTDREFLIWLYSSLLHRDPETDILSGNYWLERIKVEGRYMIYIEFIKSTEFQTVMG